MASLGVIRELMKAKSISTNEMAEYLGITTQGFLKILRENSTKVETLELIAKKLKVSISVFFEDNETKTNYEKNQKTQAQPALQATENKDENTNNAIREQENSQKNDATVLVMREMLKEKDDKIDNLNREIGRLEAENDQLRKAKQKNLSRTEMSAL